MRSGAERSFFYGSLLSRLDRFLLARAAKRLLGFGRRSIRWMGKRLATPYRIYLTTTCDSVLLLSNEVDR